LLTGCPAEEEEEEEKFLVLNDYIEGPTRCRDS